MTLAAFLGTRAARGSWRTAGAAAAWAWLVAAACGGGDVPVRRTSSAGVQDDRERTLDASVPRRRVASLVPSATETIAALGASDRLVARTDYDVQPGLAHLPSVGGGLDPSLEFLVRLEPDLVVLWRSGDGALEARLDGLGVDTYAAVVETTAGFRRLARNLGRLLHVAERADSLVASVDEGLARARASWAGREPVTAVYVVSRAPAIVAGGGTFADSVMAAAGAENAFGDLQGAWWPQVGVEEVVWRDPRYVIVPAAGMLEGAAGWAEAPAVAAGRVLEVNGGLFGRPGPRMGDAAARLALLLDSAGRR